MLTAVWPVTATSRPVPSVAAAARRRAGGARAASVAASCGAVGGMTSHGRAGGVARSSSAVDGERHAGRGLDGVGDPVAAAAWSVPVGTSVDEHERAVEAGPEALGQQVVGLPRGLCRRDVAGVGEAEAQRRSTGWPARSARRRPTIDRRPRAVLDDAAPPVGQRCARTGLAPALGDLAAQRGHEEAGDDHDDGERQGDDEQGRDAEPDAEQADGDQRGGDDARASG